MEEKNYLKWYNKVGYGSGDIAGNVVFAFLSSFIMIYLTNTVGLNAGVIGSLIAFSKILDGVSDVFFGSMIDKTHSKMGKARPWMLWAYIGCAITLVAAFAVPTDMGKTSQYIWFFIIKKYDTRIVVNVCGHTTSEYIEVVDRLADQPVDLLEINISCPNVKEGGIAFGQNPKMVEDITREIKAHAKQPVIMKLSPNVTDITEMARAAEAGGADGLSLINTLTGMKIDIHRRTFALANRTGGMSGPAVHPVAVRMVYQTAQAVNIPIVGMGGIMNADDAIEMILAGATAVSVGTANFTNPQVTMEIVDGIRDYMERYQVKDIKELVGAVHDR